MVKLEDTNIGPVKALYARWKDAVARHPIHRVVGVMMLFVEDTTSGSKLLTRLPIVGPELKDEALYRISHGVFFPIEPSDYRPTGQDHSQARQYLIIEVDVPPSPLSPPKTLLFSSVFICFSQIERL